MARKISLKNLRKKAWDLQSEYVRRLAKGKCFTCPDKRHWKEQQAGHYIHGDAVDFEMPINIRCQCVRCNHYLSGNSGVFLSRLIKEIGWDPTDKLLMLKRRVRRFGRSELEALVDRYEELIETISSKKKGGAKND